jgi:hypothetical protein
MLTSLDALIPKVLNISQDWRLQLLQSWTSIVGSLKTHMCLECIYGSTIVIGVYDSHWIQELTGLSRVLLCSVNKTLGQEYVTQVKFRLCNRREYQRPAHPPVVRTAWTYEYVQPAFTIEQQRMIEGITDKRLRRALVTFFARCAL